jgi:hypothetical protein
VRIFWLTLLVIGGILLGSLRGQTQFQKALQQEQAKQLQDDHLELCHKHFLRFYRLHMDSGKGMWHLYNEEDDKRCLDEVQRKISNGEYIHTKIE